MSISKLALHNRFRPFILANVKPEVLDNLLDANFVQLYNDVARDLNQGAEIHIERYYKTTVSANAEDDDLTNYKTQRKILKVLGFKYEGDAWADQVWTYIYEDGDGDGRIVLKSAVTSSIQMTFLYLGDVEAVTDDTDEIDLPDSVLPEFIELCKKKILSDYSQTSVVDYEDMVRFYSDKARMKMDQIVSKGGIQPYWLGLGDTDKAEKYQILDQYVTAGDNVTANVSGDYEWAS